MIGEQLSHYVLEAKLGEGTYGVVYRGVHTADPEIRVAVKVMQPWHVGDEKFMESLKAECRRLDKLDHPNLVRFRELVVQGGQVAMVLELLEGQDMFDAAKARRFSLAETVRVIESVLAGLAYAHERGVVHRDIKPGNVFLCRDGRVKILDFGIAKAAQRTDGSMSTTINGSHDYMAPERFTEAGGGPCSDVYAVGLMAWELVTGQVACVEGDFAQKYGWHAGVGPSPATVVNPRCPVWLSDVIARMVSRDLGVRPTDAGEALVALRAAVAAGGSLEPTPFLAPTAKGPTTVALPRDEVRAMVAAVAAEAAEAEEVAVAPAAVTPAVVATPAAVAPAAVSLTKTKEPGASNEGSITPRQAALAKQRNERELVINTAKQSKLFESFRGPFLRPFFVLFFCGVMWFGIYTSSYRTKFETQIMEVVAAYLIVMFSFLAAPIGRFEWLVDVHINKINKLKYYLMVLFVLLWPIFLLEVW